MEFKTEISLDGPDLPAVLSLERQLGYAAAAAATATAIDSQKEVIEAIEKTFDVTGPWYLPSNRMGIHYTPATPDNPTASLHTGAYWLKPHETGDDKKPVDGEFLAIPTDEIKPSRAPVPVANRPRNLRDAFLLETRRGPKIFRRINRALQLAYNLVRQVRIEKRSTVIEPTVRTVEENYPDNFSEKLQEALRTAK